MKYEHESLNPKPLSILFQFTRSPSLCPYWQRGWQRMCSRVGLMKTEFSNVQYLPISLKLLISPKIEPLPNSFKFLRTAIEFDIGKRTCECQAACQVAKNRVFFICSSKTLCFWLNLNDKYVNRIKLQNLQELDYEKLVSSTKLHGATEGTARVEVFHNCQQKNIFIHLLKIDTKTVLRVSWLLLTVFRSTSCLWTLRRSKRPPATLSPPSSPPSEAPWAPGLASPSAWSLRSELFYGETF